MKKVGIGKGIVAVAAAALMAAESVADTTVYLDYRGIKAPTNAIDGMVTITCRTGSTAWNWPTSLKPEAPDFDGFWTIRGADTVPFGQMLVYGTPGVQLWDEKMRYVPGAWTTNGTWASPAEEILVLARSKTGKFYKDWGGHSESTQIGIMWTDEITTTVKVSLKADYAPEAGVKGSWELAFSDPAVLAATNADGSASLVMKLGTDRNARIPRHIPAPAGRFRGYWAWVNVRDDTDCEGMVWDENGNAALGGRFWTEDGVWRYPYANLTVYPRSVCPEGGTVYVLDPEGGTFEEGKQTDARGRHITTNNYYRLGWKGLKPSRRGYTFGGFFTMPHGAGIKFMDERMQYGDITGAGIIYGHGLRGHQLYLYACWKEDTVAARRDGSVRYGDGRTLRLTAGARYPKSVAGPLVVELMETNGTITAAWKVDAEAEEARATNRIALCEAERKALIAAGPAGIEPGTLAVDADGMKLADDAAGNVRPVRQATRVGTVDYGTGALELDAAALRRALGAWRPKRYGAFTNEYAGLTVTVATVSHPMKRSRVQEVFVLGAPDNGGKAQWPYIVSAYIDANGDGKWTAGEPFGANWADTVTEAGVTLSQTTGEMARYDLSALVDGNVETATDRTVGDNDYEGLVPAVSITNAVANPRDLRMRIVRTHVNGRSQANVTNFSTVVLDRTVDCVARPRFTEADMLAAGQWDIDWGGIESTWSTVFDGNRQSITNAAYRVVVRSATTEASEINEMLPEVFINRYEVQEYQTPVQPLAPSGRVFANRPTFTWRHSNAIGKLYPAFELKVWKADGVTLVYDSGIRRAPACTSDGVYTWTAPLYMGSATGQGFMFNAATNYRWAVSMLDAKFTTFPALTVRAPYKVQTKGWRPDDGSCGNIMVKMEMHSLASLYEWSEGAAFAKTIRLRAYETPECLGEPEGEGIVMVGGIAELGYMLDDDKGIESGVKRRVAQGVIRGLQEGSYYVLAFLDTDGDGELDEWETAGMSELPIRVCNGKTVEVNLEMENTDTDGDGYEDAYEMEREGDLEAIGTAAIR